MKHSICIDGGGTKTSFILYSPEGIELAKSVDETIHLQQVEYEDAKKIVQTNVRIIAKAANVSLSDVVISAGLAGYGSNIVIKEKFNLLFDEVFPNNKVYLTSDGHTALLGALDSKDGVLVIAGTGSIAFRLNKGELTRSGGWGFILGDEGSAYDIACKLLSTFTKQADGRLPRTSLYDGVMRILDLQDPYDLVKYVNTILKGSRNQIARISKVNYQLAMEGDPHAIEIFNEAAQELANHVNALVSEGEEVEVSYIGGVFNSKEFVLDPMSKLIGKAKLVEPKFGPEYGAYLFYKQQIEK